ncbi:little elongation complex subunit 2 isoform X1 [Pleurodeles waltl]|uniref:little elongation complex subunit 2 isoform X1 n=1 Tax=Pleurodeles waltl TaxID=8319 RepID=UPI0037098533
METPLQIPSQPEKVSSFVMAKGKSGTLMRDVVPKNGIEFFFSRESYEKYSMSPNLLELWHLANRPSSEKASRKDDQVSVPRTTASSEEVNEILQPTLTIVPLPEPITPYPVFSCLTAAQQKTYVHLMAKYSSRIYKASPRGPQKLEYLEYQNYKTILNKEIADFLKFMQNNARNCAADYDHISKDVLQYTEELIKASLELVKKYPETYVLHDITSIMGGKVCTDLAFKLEKTLLALGRTYFIKVCFPVMPSLLPIPVDYQTVSRSRPAEKRASAQHQDISSDPNAEKLALKYRPQVALTAQSLFTLLNNHGINYKEQWELPVCVKKLQNEGAEPVKMVYIDPPLPKKELSVREKNQMFHEVPFEFWMNKNTYAQTPVMDLDHLKKEQVSNDIVAPPRPLEPESMELDFEGDVTELETFGVTCNPLKTFKKPSSPVKPKSLLVPLLTKLQLEKEVLTSGGSNSEDLLTKESQQITEQLPCSFNDQSNPKRFLPSYESLFSDSDDAQSFKGFASDEIEEFVESNSDADTTEVSESSSEVRTKQNCSKAETSTDNVGRSTSCTSDTDEERLVIDIECKDNESWPEKKASASEAIPDTPRSPSPVPTASTNPLKVGRKRKCSPSKPVNKLSKDVDPVGQILKMQVQLMKSNSKKAAEQPLGSPEKGSSVRLPPVLSPTHNATGATITAESCETESSGIPGFTPPLHRVPQGEEKKATDMLPDRLQMLVEDASEYTAPEDGNLVYKLFSLDGMLLLVRCSVQKAWTHSKRIEGKKVCRHMPTFILPKVEYQACYGVEALTESEACRLWTESLLHSRCTFFVGHIDVFSSGLFMLEEYAADAIQDKFGTFKPSDSLNILRHILKKVTSLQEGSYLLTHAAGDSSVLIYKSTNSEVKKSSYNLHKAHSTMPREPSTLSVPWVPLDPTILLPYHVSQGRVPCTFPPPAEDVTSRTKSLTVGVAANQRQMPNSASMETDCSDVSTAAAKGGSPKKKKNKGKRQKRFLKWNAKKMQRQPKLSQIRAGNV